jgi:hypothetical protein
MGRGVVGAGRKPFRLSSKNPYEGQVTETTQPAKNIILYVRIVNRVEIEITTMLEQEGPTEVSLFSDCDESNQM